MLYEWRPGWTWKCDPEKAAKQFKKLEKDKQLSPYSVVKSAEKKSSPLHNDFEWNDNVAGHKWRLHTARNMIHCLLVRDDEQIKNEEAIPKYVNLVIERNEEKVRSYLDIKDVLNDPEERRLLLYQWRREADSWERRYGMLEELIPVFETIRQAKMELM